jgi:hypothetical protein
MVKYKIVRHYLRDRGNRTIKHDLTLAEAQQHCQDPETSSKTCTSEKGKRHTRRFGAWFDGYTEEKT